MTKQHRNASKFGKEIARHSGGRTHRRLRFQRLDSRQLLAADLMNADNPVDVNADGEVTPYDALAVINELSDLRSGFASGETAAVQEKLYPDTNGDSQITPADILNVLEVLAQGEDVGLAAVSASSIEEYLGSSLSAFSGDTVNFTLSESDLDIFVGPNSSGDIVVSVAGVGEEIVPAIPKTVNITVTGSNNSINFSGLVIQNDLSVNLSGNGNEFMLDGTRVGDDFLAYGGAGNNSFALVNYTVVEDQAIFKMKGGDDQIFLDRTYVGGQLIAELGAGNDQLGIYNSTIKENLKVEGGSGNDDLELTRANIYNDFFFYGHGGNDRLRANRSWVSDDAIIKLGDGDDQVFVFGSVVNDRAKVDGEAGVDTLFANTADFITDDLDVDRIERVLAASDPGESTSIVDVE